MPTQQKSKKIHFFHRRRLGVHLTTYPYKLRQNIFLDPLHLLATPMVNRLIKPGFQPYASNARSKAGLAGVFWTLLCLRCVRKAINLA